MKKKTFLILLIIDIVLGSIITFYSGNLLSSDLSNMFYGIHDFYIVSSIPMLMITIDFIIVFIFIIRYYRYNYKKALVNLYTKYLVINGLVGIITSIISAFIYHSLIKPYPFKFYLIIMLIVHIAIIIFGILENIRNKKNRADDTEIKKIKFHNVLYSAILGILLFFAFYRFGSVLLGITYIQLRTLYLTIWFYLWALLPMMIVVHIILYFFDIYKKKIHSVIYIDIIFILNLILGITVMVLGSKYSIFISAISPALPLERLATKPLDIISNFIIMILLTGYYFYYSIKNYLSEKKK